MARACAAAAQLPWGLATAPGAVLDAGAPSGHPGWPGGGVLCGSGAAGASAAPGAPRRARATAADGLALPALAGAGAVLAVLRAAARRLGAAEGRGLTAMRYKPGRGKWKTDKPGPKSGKWTTKPDRLQPTWCERNPGTMPRKPKLMDTYDDGRGSDPMNNFYRQMQAQQNNQFNIMLRKGWQKGSRRLAPPRLLYEGEVEPGANPWVDRFLVCKGCEMRGLVDDLPPIEGCNGTAVLEVDITAQFTRENTLVVSCDILQLIMTGIWVTKDQESGEWVRASDKPGDPGVPGAIPVQVCASCRKTTLDEGRAFDVCQDCQGVWYCSDECCAAHRMKHKATCCEPYLPHRKQWGVKEGVKGLRDEMYPLTGLASFREPHEHRMPWLRRPEHAKKLAPGGVRTVSLPGFGDRTMLPVRSGQLDQIRTGADGTITITPAQTVSSREPRMVRETPEPDPEILTFLNMTRDEYVEKDQKMQLALAKEDCEALGIVGIAPVARSAESEAGPTPSWVKPKQRRVMDGVDEPRTRPGRVELDERAVQRLEAAQVEAVRPGQPRPEVVPAPWVAFERSGADEDEEFEVIKPNPGAGDLPPPAERKEGVVYRDSLVRQDAKRRGLRLSEEALQRMEAVGTVARKEAKDKNKQVSNQRRTVDARHTYGDFLSESAQQVGRAADQRKANGAAAATRRRPPPAR